MNYSRVPFTENPDITRFASSIIDPIREPVLVIDANGSILAANKGFRSEFHFDAEELQGEKIFQLQNLIRSEVEFKGLISELMESGTTRNRPLNLNLSQGEERRVSVNGNSLTIPGESTKLFLLSFNVIINTGSEITYRKLLNEILSEAPAFICILRGPEHMFELANERYLQLVAYRDIIGKKVREALPEVENQGFLDMLDDVYYNGKPFIGKEIALDLYQRDGSKHKSQLDFVYQPIFSDEGKVDGIFVHGIDVTEKVQNRKKLEDNQTELRNWIDTVPVIIWLTNALGEGFYFNKNWYSYTGQTREESKGEGWLSVVHPEDREETRKRFLHAHEERKDFNATYRLRNKEGEYRWVIDRGRAKYGPQGEYQGFIGSLTDVHEDKLKEQLIKENEVRIRSIVEEATVATAIYLGTEMTIEFANDAMIELWGKDPSVRGKTLREALPELDGQPFHDLLQKVFSTGEIYWGEEDRVDLMHNGKMETGFFKFTYKPLRDGKGEIYGILNMATNVTEIVNSRNLLKEREEHFRLLADLMPEKVMNTNSKGEAIYFNQNWIDYTGLSNKALMDAPWTGFIHEEDRMEFLKNWQRSLQTGVPFETEVRLRNKAGKYLWHLNRVDAVRDEQGEVKMWIGTSTEIQRLKEEEKRKGDFLKMVSHELKTPVTSIKGYVQLLLNMLQPVEDKLPAGIPLKTSLERIDNQVIRLTRLISEMLDLSRLEENKLELNKDVFSLNELIDQTVQDIKLTNTQHQMTVFHTCRAEVEADRDRIGQVLINFITNAIKYSPESRNIEIHIIEAAPNKVGVSVRDQGIGIDKKYHKNIFKRFYRIGGVNEETYSGFGIGLYLANEIIERHNGSIEVKSRKGTGSDFCFKLSAVSIEK
ncbi:PAS domain S-box protein [Salinimicrobium sp. CDJ15-81-2]|nr:PAS domain S-box protein [Salinimicrobium nanhaiense]